MVQKDYLKKEKIVVIAGPTGIGKSDYAVELALRYNGEIVGADSVQVYKKLDIGSGKITRDEMRGVPHHMIDIVEPDEPFTVVDYLTKAKACITDIISRGKLPFVVGGTGFYLNALLHGYTCGTTAPNYALRNRLNKMEDANGKGFLHSKLMRMDSRAAEKVNANDTTRVIRQLEMLLMPQISAVNEESDEVYTDVYNAILIVMDADRYKLDAMAARRIKKMLAAGFWNEVESLKPYFNCKGLNTVGYHDIKLGIELGLDKAEVEDAIKSNYHALIKKQQTYFRWLRWSNKHTIFNGDKELAEKELKKFIKKG